MPINLDDEAVKSGGLHDALGVAADATEIPEDKEKELTDDDKKKVFEALSVEESE